MGKQHAYITNFFMADAINDLEKVYESEEKRAAGESLLEVEYRKEIAVSFTAKGFNESIITKRNTQIIFVLNFTGDPLTEQQRKEEGAYEIISGITCTKAFKITKVDGGLNEVRTTCERIKANQLVGYWAAVVLDFANMLVRTVLDFANEDISLAGYYEKKVVNNLMRAGRHTKFLFFHNGGQGIKESGDVLYKMAQAALNIAKSEQCDSLIEPYLQRERQKSVMGEMVEIFEERVNELTKTKQNTFYNFEAKGDIELFLPHKDMDLSLQYLKVSERVRSEDDCIEFNYQLAIDRALDERDFEKLKEILKMKAEGTEC